MCFRGHSKDEASGEWFCLWELWTYSGGMRIGIKCLKIKRVRYPGIFIRKAQETAYSFNTVYQDDWECERSKRIEGIQRNENPFVKGECVE